MLHSTALALVCASAAITVPAHGQALASDPAPAPATVAPETPAASTANVQDGAAAAAGPAVGDADIVVTAQRRSENVQRVPIAITVIDPVVQERLNIRDLQTLQVVTPGLQVSSGNGYAQTYIRGIGANFSNPGVENPVSVYVDGAYIVRGQGGNVDVVDTASVQVLKGPQGTLWGRNSTGGTILVATADPEFEVGGRVVGEIGNQGHRLLEGAVNVPLTDTLALRVAGRYREDGGYIRNLPDNYLFGWQDATTIRGKLLWKPTADLRIVAGIQHDSGAKSLGANAQFLPDAFCSRCSTSAYRHPFADPYTTSISLLNNGVGNVSRSDLYTLKVAQDLGKFAITSVTTYNKASESFPFDADLVEGAFLHFIIPATYKTFTQNVTLTTQLGGMIEGMAGVDYLQDRSSYIINGVSTNSPPFPQIPLNYVQTYSISPFAEINLKPVDHLTLTAGGRFTSDVRHGQHTGFTDRRVQFDSFSPRLVVAYDAGPVNVYASFNRGSKAGGLNSTSVPMQVFNPETLDSYEVGAKFVSDDRRVRFNIAAFHYDYRQLQTLSIDQGNTGNVGTIQNPDARVNGVDLDANWRAAEWLTFIGGASFLRTKYVNFVNAIIQYPTGTPTGPATGTRDLSGTRLPHAPQFTGFLGATLASDLGGGWKGNLTGLVNHSSSFDFFPGAGGPLGVDRQPAFTTARLSGSVTPEGERYEIGFYVDNLTDAKTYNMRFTTAPFGALQVINRPRTYGLRVAVKY